ncbi:MAG: hypothetical protein ABSG54_11985 [Terriglobia bacterium]|jgi:hypothetical protein
MSIVTSPNLLRLAQDLEWLGCELEYQGMKHAQEGFPGAGPAWEAFVRMREGVIATIDKIERELKASMTYNPKAFVGVDFPLDAAMDAIGVQLAALQEIRSCADYSVHELPGKVRGFTRMVESYLTAIGAVER